MIETFIDLRPAFVSDVFGHELETFKGAGGAGFAPVILVEPPRGGGGDAAELMGDLPEAEGELGAERGGALALEAAGEDGSLEISALDVLNGNGIITDVEGDLDVLFVFESRALFAALFVSPQ